MGVNITVRCLCGQLNESCQLRDDAPNKGSLCHCNICRRVTGALTFSGCALLNAPGQIFQSKLTKFATSEAIDRYFCSTCGSHVCYYVVSEDRWSACAGAVDHVDTDDGVALEEYTEHEYVGDTVDGGLACLFPDIPLYLEDDGQEKINSLEKAVSDMQKDVAFGHELVKAECYCGQVSMSIRPSADERYEATICGCRSCRLEFGQPLPVWAMRIPFENIIWGDGAVYDGSPHQAITTYRSSDHASWDFCSKCGAAVFYRSSKRPERADVAMGIIRAEDGALARSLVRWDTEKTPHFEEAMEKTLLEITKSNLSKLDNHSGMRGK